LLARLERLSHHGGDEGFLVYFAGIENAVVYPVLDDGDPVREEEDVFEKMRDKDDRDALFLQFFDNGDEDLL
jgi:hypothetical protein